MDKLALSIVCPGWLAGAVDWEARYASTDDRVRVAIALARENVDRGTGGPFGAAVFERQSGRLVGAGVNLVTALENSVLHAEVVALMLAERRVGAFSLRGPGMPEHELAASCDPCAMCLGATLWSGVTHLVTGASRDDARAIGFEEGPVFPESYRYLEARGVTVTRGVLRDEGRAVLALYAERGGAIYNG